MIGEIILAIIIPTLWNIIPTAIRPRNGCRAKNRYVKNETKKLIITNDNVVLFLKQNIKSEPKNMGIPPTKGTIKNNGPKDINAKLHKK